MFSILTEVAEYIIFIHWREIQPARSRVSLEDAQGRIYSKTSLVAIDPLLLVSYHLPMSSFEVP